MGAGDGAGEGLGERGPSPVARFGALILRRLRLVGWEEVSGAGFEFSSWIPARFLGICEVVFKVVVGFGG